MGPELAATTVAARSSTDAAAAATRFQDKRTLERARSNALRSRYPFAGEILTLFEALLDVWCSPGLLRPGRAQELGTANRASLATYAAERVMPLVIDATLAQGPQALAAAASDRFVKGNLVEIAARWLAGEDLVPVDRYLARASLQPLLETFDADIIARFFERPSNDLHCPRCNGLPQVSYFEPSHEALVTGPRRVLCARCSHSWSAQRMTCVSCGEQTGARLPVFGEQETFPHIRVDACESCKRYLLTIDLKKDRRALPLVDELAALPLDIYAQERGYTKIVSNLMGN